MASPRLDIIKNNILQDLSDKRLELDPLERIIVGVLKNEEMNIDEIIVATGRNMVEISTALSMMSLKGIVSEAGGRYFLTRS